MSATNILGEFSDPDRERQYREDSRSQEKWRMTMICVITSIVYLLALGIDYMEMDSGSNLLIMAAARGITFAFGMAAAVLAWNRPSSFLFFTVIMIYMCLIGVSESIEVALHFDSANGIIIPTVVIIVLMYYLFSPVRLLSSLIPAVFISLLYSGTVIFCTSADSGYVINIILSFVVANGYGIVHLTTFNRVRRKEYSALIEQRRLNDELQKEIITRKETEAKLQDLATKDELTDVYNRRFFMEMFTKDFERSKRYSYPLSLLMIDADHFKDINDNYGHDVGDSALLHLTGLINHELRHTDILARFGGEEFSTLLPGTNLKNATEAAKRICTAIANTPFDAAGKPVTVTVSIGVASLGEDCDSEEAMLKVADDALYKAKEQGRNRVVSMHDLKQGASRNAGDPPAK